MQLINVSPTSLSKNPWNTNKVSPENQQKLVQSVLEFGVFKPIICRRVKSVGLQILGGEHRNDAAITLGLPEVPVLDLGEIDDTTAKKIGLADNGRYGSDDSHELAELLSELGSAEEIAAFMPWSGGEIEAIISSTKIDLDDLESHGEEPVLEDEDDSSEPAPKPTKTHEIMRFKFTLADAAKVRELVKEAQKTHGFTKADDLTNAGDALIQLIFNS